MKTYGPNNDIDPPYDSGIDLDLSYGPMNDLNPPYDLNPLALPYCM